MDAEEFGFLVDKGSHQYGHFENLEVPTVCTDTIMVAVNRDYGQPVVSVLLLDPERQVWLECLLPPDAADEMVARLTQNAADVREGKFG